MIADSQVYMTQIPNDFETTINGSGRTEEIVHLRCKQTSRILYLNSDPLTNQSIVLVIKNFFNQSETRFCSSFMILVAPGISSIQYSF